MQINSKKLKFVEKPIRLNEDFIKILEELKNIMILQGEPFRAKAYQKAMENIIMFKDNITNPNEQLKNVPGIGITILEKLNEFKETGTLKILERERNNPLNILTKVYGIGPKKAKELIGKDITTIDHLRKNTQELNDKQIIGLKYFDDIIQRIPRSEIEIFNQNLTELFKDPTLKDSNFNIVGSFRRGHENSGDIDVIICDSYNFPNSFDVILDKLIENKIIIEVLSRGKIKCLTIIKGIDGDDSPCRRADFLYSDPKEYAFAQLYFTGSKIFNTFMRQRALDLGYTLNEHGISKMEKGVKTKGVEEKFESEEDIFNFLGMKYKIPEERIDGRSVEILNEEIKEKNEIDFEEKIEKKMNVKIENKKMAIQHNKTLKIVPNDSFKKQIQKIKKEGITAIKLMTENELTKLIHKANDAYYCDEDPILDDNLYDILINYIQKKYPHNNIGFSNHTGCNVEVKKNKVELPYQLWSMDKVKPHTGAVLKWAMKFQ